MDNQYTKAIKAQEKFVEVYMIHLFNTYESISTLMNIICNYSLSTLSIFKKK